MVSDGKQQILVVREYAFDENVDKELPEILATDRILQLPFRNSRIIWSGGVATLLPTRLFNPVDRRIPLELLTDLPESHLVKEDAISQISATNIYAIDPKRWDMLQQKFPGARLFHIYSALIWGCRMWAGHRQGKQVFIHIRPEFFQLLVFDNNNLLLVNQYSYRSVTDFLYYVMLIFDQFKMDPETHPLYLSGKILKEAEIYRLLIRYIRKVEFLKPPAFFKFGQKLTQRPHYFFFDLLCALLCK